MHVICPACGATNMVPDARLRDGPLCGKCRTPLLPDEPASVRDSALPPFLFKTEQLVLADFWADWCGPCKVMAPQFAEAARQLPEVRFIKVDTEACPNAAARYKIQSLPTLILFKRAREIARLSGAMSAGQIVTWVRRYTGQGAS
jgi:thioredoxin 2